MAIALDATSSGLSATNASSLSFNHTCGTGLNNTLLVVMVGYYANPASRSVSTLTYNSVSMTKIQRNSNGTNAAATEAWYLVAPSTGTNSVAITMSGAVGAGDYISGFSYSFSAALQTGIPDAQSATPNITTGTHSSMSTSVTTIAPNAWLIDVISAASATTAGGSQANVLNQNGTGQAFGASTQGPILTPASTAMSWTFTSSGTATAQTVISIAPVGVGWLVGGLLVGPGRGVAGGV